MGAFKAGSSLYLVLAPEVLTCPKEKYKEKSLGFEVKVYRRPDGSES